MTLLETIKQHEGFRDTPYKCTKGVWTIGYGFTSLSIDESEVVLQMKLDKIKATLSTVICNLSPTRQEVLINMAYNLGTDGLFKFRRMWECIYRKDYPGASREMLSSEWSKQVGYRAVELAEKMRVGR